MVTPRLLGAIFFAIDYEALKSAGTRRIPLGEVLSDDPDLISDLLSTADTETARDLANSLLLNQGFEELTKKSLLARFIKLFPSLQSLVSGDAGTKDEQFLVSRESYEHKRTEYEEIVSKRIPDNSKAILAYKTPLGQAIMGKKVGEHVKLKIGATNHEYQIAGIVRYNDSKKA